MAPIPIVIDTDAGADPDDVFALALALASPEVELLGVTVVSGDVDLRARIVGRVLGLAGRPDIPIYKGRAPVDAGNDPTMLGTEGKGVLDVSVTDADAAVFPVPAAEWLAAEARRRPYHLVAIGPLTNVADAFRDDPELAGRLLGFTAMGGVFTEAGLPTDWRRDVRERGHAAAWPDYNTVTDSPAALAVANAVAAAGVPTTWVTVETTVRAPLRRSSLPTLPETPLVEALRQATVAWSDPWFRPHLPANDDVWAIPDDTVTLLHDPLALASLFAADWLTLRRVPLRYEIADGVFRMREAAPERGAPAHVSVAVDGARFEAFCLGRIAALATNSGGGTRLA